MILGITGGSGCGKTTLLSCIREQGGLVLDCDAIYHDLLKTDREMLAKIDARFPETVTEGVLDRKQLGAVVFSDEKALLDLNAITHTAVKREIRRRLKDHPGLAAIDAIALHEGRLAQLCDKTVAVTAPVEDRVRRLTHRDGITEEYARSRIAAQHPQQWFAERCDYVLENSGSREDFRRKCLAFLGELGIIKA